jgi:hypothetical protein
MSNTFDSFDIRARFSGVRHWRRRAIVAGVLLLGVLIVFLMTWNAFFVYVPPGQHLVSRQDGEIRPWPCLAKRGEKGIQREVGEGWHLCRSSSTEDRRTRHPGG